MIATAFRRCLEMVVNSFVECFETECMKDGLGEKLNLLRRKDYFTKEIADKAHDIRRLGNRGAHDDNGAAISGDDLQDALLKLEAIIDYYSQY